MVSNACDSLRRTRSIVSIRGVIVLAGSILFQGRQDNDKKKTGAHEYAKSDAEEDEFHVVLSGLLGIRLRATFARAVLPDNPNEDQSPCTVRIICGRYTS